MPKQSCAICDPENLEDNQKYILDSYSYSAWGWFALAVLNVSATPTKLKRYCSQCDKVVEEIVDPTVLQEHVGR